MKKTKWAVQINVIGPTGKVTQEGYAELPDKNTARFAASAATQAAYEYEDDDFDPEAA